MFEFNPTLIEAIEHSNARIRVFHALRLKERFPGFTGDGFYADRTIQKLGEGGCYIIRAHAVWTFQFYHSSTVPFFLKQLSCYTPYVCRGYHWHFFFERLKKALNNAFFASRR